MTSWSKSVSWVLYVAGNCKNFGNREFLSHFFILRARILHDGSKIQSSYTVKILEYLKSYLGYRAMTENLSKDSRCAKFWSRKCHIDKILPLAGRLTVTWVKWESEKTQIWPSNPEFRGYEVQMSRFLLFCKILNFRMSIHLNHHRRNWFYKIWMKIDYTLKFREPRALLYYILKQHWGWSITTMHGIYMLSTLIFLFPQI